MFVSFEMAPDDLQPFLAFTHISSLAPTQGSALSEFKGLVQHDVNWILDDNQIYLYGKGTGRLETQFVVVDTDDPDTYVAYVITFLM